MQAWMRLLPYTVVVHRMRPFDKLRDLMARLVSLPNHLSGLWFLLKRSSVRAPFDVDVAECLDFRGCEAGVCKDGLGLSDSEFQKRLDPFLFADKQEFCTVEVQHERNLEKLCGTERDVGVRERPLGVDYVGSPFAANPETLDEPVDDVGDGEQLQPRL